MKITVKRYDPSKDNAPYETTYEVPHDDEYMTLLQALVYIHENEEPLAFDFSCRGRMCGRCAMMLDGEPVLACVEPLPDGKSCRVVVPDDQLSLAIGKEGQNARLAAKLTGYKIDIKPASAPLEPIEAPEEELFVEEAEAPAEDSAGTGETAPAEED